MKIDGLIRALFGPVILLAEGLELMSLSLVEPMLDPSLRVLSIPLQEFDAEPLILGAAAGLPAGALYIAPANLILAGSPCDAPLFREAIVEACTRFGRDVALVRTGLFPETLNPVTVDIAIMGQNEPFLITDGCSCEDSIAGYGSCRRRPAPSSRFAGTDCRW